MKHGGFNLRKWKTNSPHVQQSIDEMEDSSNSTDEIPEGEGHEEVKLLVLYWSTLTDTFYFDFKNACDCICQDSAFNKTFCAESVD